METSSQLTGKLKVGLLDFEPLRITGLREIFAEQPEFQVVATDWPAAFRDLSLDLVVVVLRDQAFSLALLARLRSRNPGLKVLVIGSGSEPEKILEAISAGAKGWLEETANPEQVMQAACAILDGSIWAPRRVLSTFVDRALEGSAARRGRRTSPRFTEREEEVLQQLVLARSNREIAQALSIREQTVKSYVARLMRKVGVGNRIALSVQAASGAWGEKKP
jgi:DNA-binding NarL/FixJ family response regulator